MGVAYSVDQRWSQRRPLMLEVELYSAGQRLASCMTRDVGLGGAYVEGSPDQVGHYSEVDLYFNLYGTKGVTSRYRLRARVVRKDDMGIGVAFKDFDTSSFRALQEIMRHGPLPMSA